MADMICHKVYELLMSILKPFKALVYSRVLSDVKRSAAPRVLYLIKHSYTRALNST
jgi:hypothetical protein